MIWYYIEKGQGCFLVLLYGIGMNSDVWLFVMDCLVVECRVIVFDIFGFGFMFGFEIGKLGVVEMVVSLS